MIPTRSLVVGAAAVSLAGCALLGFGPKTSVVHGWVYGAEDAMPLPQAEVCAFGLDTLCVRADGTGRYSFRLKAQAVVLRFRSGSLSPAISDTIAIVPPQQYEVSCAISGRLVISERPPPCQRVPRR